MKRRIISEVEGFTCNNHSLGWIDDHGNWNDCGGYSHGEWLIINYYNNNPPERYTIPPNWIKVSNANNIFFCGESFNDVTAAQVDALIEMWSLCREYSNWIKNEPETFYVTFGIIDQHEPKEKLLDMFEMTIPEFLDQYGDRSAMDNFYEMLLEESIGNEYSANIGIISEVNDFTCNKHSLGFIDAKGEFIEAQMLNSNYSETHSDILDRLGFDEDEIYDTPSGWIKISNSNEFWFEGHDWYDVTPEQIDSMITVWKLCSTYSRWIKDETETKQLYFRCFGGLKRLTIAEFLKAYGSQEQIDNLYSTLLGESAERGYFMNKKYRNPFAASPEEIGQENVPVESELLESALRKYIRNVLLEIYD